MSDRNSTEAAMPADVAVDRGARDGDWIVRVRGEIDVATSPDLKAQLGSVLDQHARVVTLDVSDLAFIDSSGLGVLVGAHKRLLETGGENMVLRGLQEPVRRVFEITGLTRLFTVED
jgi:anti-sigma B factor antagonist